MAWYDVTFNNNIIVPVSSKSIKGSSGRREATWRAGTPELKAFANHTSVKLFALICLTLL
jgi:hypothetical protein